MNRDRAYKILELEGHKNIVKVVNILGKETKVINNQPLFFIYDDSPLEKKIIID